MLTNIDVTLRDGGYRNNFDFPLGYALDHARTSAGAGVEWIEIAYRNGSFKPVPDIGLTGRGDDAFIRAAADAIGPDRVCVILHPHNTDDDDLAAVHEAGARLLRICADASAPAPALATLARAKQLGFTTAINLTRVTHHSRRQLVHVAADAAELGADVVYLADSNGSLLPADTHRLVTAVGHVVDCEIGLHAHNNLGLALANAIAATEAGATWIDSSVLGMGKGPGNLITEQWLAYLIRQHGTARYDLGSALALAEKLRRDIPEASPELPLPDLLLGWFDLTVEHRARLRGDGIGALFDSATELARNARAAA
ncbi:hypothetical protein [Kitasatospora sp. NPDC085879]|uniref:hypothetical protein n=1 Tax=Kitasatospora sp. NPDC085879 TaxID=3154769 RepID=UPI00341E8D97